MEVNMKYWQILSLSLAFILLTAFVPWGNCRSTLAAESQTIRMGYIEFTPVFYTDSNGVPQGLLIDLARIVVPEAGYQLEFESLPVKRMTSSLIKGDIDLWAGLKTLEGFEENTYSGDSRLLQICLNAYAINDEPQIVKKEDLNGKMIVGLRGYSYGGWGSYLKDPANEIDFIEVDTHASALKVFDRNNKAGNKCYLLGYEQPVNKALMSYGVNNLKQAQISCLDAYFVVSQKTPNARTVLRQLETTYQRLKKSGQIE